MIMRKLITLALAVLSLNACAQKQENNMETKALVVFFSHAGEVRYDTIPGLNHPQTCEQSFTAERIGWVMGHSKQ